MKVTSKDVEQLGINYIETDISSNVVAIKGKLPPKRKLLFVKITDKTIYWKDKFDLDYIGG